MKKRLGELLIERGLIDVDQLNSALSHQRQWGMRLGTALVAKGFVAEGMLTRVLSESLGFPMVDLSRIVIEPKALQLVPRRVCEQHDVLPLGLKEQGGRKLLFLAMADPLNATVIDEIAFTSSRRSRRFRRSSRRSVATTWASASRLRRSTSTPATRPPPFSPMSR